jgi:hypothetical protein
MSLFQTRICQEVLGDIDDNNGIDECKHFTGELFRV